MTTTRRYLAASIIWFSFAAWAALPAAAQVDVRYTGPGRAVPTIGGPGGSSGGVQSETGQRTVSPGGESVPTEVLASKVSGAAGETARASVQGLAFTGADFVTLVTIGFITIVLGIVLNRRARPGTMADR